MNNNKGILSINGKDIFVLMNGEWVPAKEIDFNIRVPAALFKIFDTETLQGLLDFSIKKEEYETAGIINKVMNNGRKRV